MRQFRLDARSPSEAAVFRNGLADAAFHPRIADDVAVLLLHEHVLVELGILLRNLRSAAKGERLATVRRGIQARRPGSPAPMCDRERPRAVLENGRLAHHYAFRYGAGLRRLGRNDIRVWNRGHQKNIGIDVVLPPREVAAYAVRPRPSERTVRRDPHLRIKRTLRATSVRIGDEHLAPSRAVVFRSGEDDVVVLVLGGRCAAVPRRPKPPVRRDGHAGDERRGAGIDVVRDSIWPGHIVRRERARPCRRIDKVVVHEKLPTRVDIDRRACGLNRQCDHSQHHATVHACSSR